MQQYEYCVSSFDIAIRLAVEGSHEFFGTLINNRFWQEFIPNFSTKSVYPANASWKIIESETCRFDLKTKEIYIDKHHIKEAVVIIDSQLEPERQKRGLYTFHGSAIARQDKAVGLIGNMSGLGKTSIGSYGSSHGWSWIADEKFTVKNGNIVGGVRGVLDDAKTKAAASNTMPKIIDKTYNLAILCLPMLTTEKTSTKFDLSYEKKLWIYNEEITRDIRQVNGILGGDFPNPLPSFDTDTIAVSRVETVKKLSQKVHGVFVRGSAETILGEIDLIIDRISHQPIDM